MSNFIVKAKKIKNNKIYDVAVIDNFFGNRKPGYAVDKEVLPEDIFYKRFKSIERKSFRQLSKERQREIINNGVKDFAQRFEKILKSLKEN